MPERHFCRGVFQTWAWGQGGRHFRPGGRRGDRLRASDWPWRTIDSTFWCWCGLKYEIDIEKLFSEFHTPVFFSYEMENWKNPISFPLQTALTKRKEINHTRIPILIGSRQCGQRLSNGQKRLRQARITCVSTFSCRQVADLLYKSVQSGNF